MRGRPTVKTKWRLLLVLLFFALLALVVVLVKSGRLPALEKYFKG
jgi:hypothetical protein